MKNFIKENPIIFTIGFVVTGFVLDNVIANVINGICYCAKNKKA